MTKLRAHVPLLACAAALTLSAAATPAAAEGDGTTQHFFTFDVKMEGRLYALPERPPTPPKFASAPKPFKLDSIRDGTSNTFFVGERASTQRPAPRGDSQPQHFFSTNVGSGR